MESLGPSRGSGLPPGSHGGGHGVTGARAEPVCPRIPGAGGPLQGRALSGSPGGRSVYKTMISGNPLGSSLGSSIEPEWESECELVPICIRMTGGSTGKSPRKSLVIKWLPRKLLGGPRK